MLIRKDAVVEAGGFNESIRVCEDWDLWVRLRSKHPFGAVLDPIATCYRTTEALSRDVDRMLSTSEQILESTLLVGLSGYNRALWRRRIRSAQLASAAITAKEVRSGQERSLLLRSIFQWPSPFLAPRRYAALARVLMGPMVYGFLTRPFRGMTGSPLLKDSSKNS